MTRGSSLANALTLWRFPSRLVLVALSLVLVLGGGVWFLVGRSAERVLDSLRWFGRVEVDSVSADWAGDVRVRGLRLTSYEAVPRLILAAERVDIDTPGLLWMLTLGFGGERQASIEAHLSPQHVAAVRAAGGLPAALPPAARFGIAARGLSVGPALAEFGELRWFGRVSASPFDAAGCGIDRDFDESDLLRMGLSEGAVEARMSMRRLDAATAAVEIGFARAGSSRATLSMRVRADDPERILDGDPGALIALERRWEVVDEGFVAARNRYCASRLGISRDGYVDRHVDAVRARLAGLGVRADPAVEGVYRRFAGRGGELTWLARPSLATTFAQMARFAPAQQLRLLNATIESTRGRAVPFALTVEALPAAEPPALAAAAAGGDAPDGERGAATGPAPSAGVEAAAAGGAVLPPPPAAASASTAPPAAAAPAMAVGAASPGAAVTVAAAASPPQPATLPPTAAAAPAPPSPPAQVADTADAGAGTVAPLPPLPRRSAYAPGQVVPYEALRGMEGRRFEIVSVYGTRRRGILEKYTDAALTVRLSGREGALRLSMPQRTVREVRLLDHFADDDGRPRESG